MTPLLIVGLLPNLVSCTTSNDKNTDISIDDQGFVQCSNNTISGLTPTAFFTLQLSNILEGDILNILIDSQDKDGKEGAFINADAESQNIKLHYGQKNATIPFTLLSDDEKDEIFEVHFSIICTITRSDNIIFKTAIKDLYFENATPTTRDMFAYQTNSDGDKILIGWSEEPWVKPQLSKCNVLIIPDDVTEIADGAFIEVSDVHHTTIPENIKYAYLDSGFGHHHEISKLSKIGDQAFFGSHHVVYKNITFPDMLSEIGQQAFMECNKFEGVLTFGPNIQRIYDAAFSGCGDGLTSLIFNSCCSLRRNAFSNSCESIQSIDVRVYGSTLPSDWIDYFLFYSIQESTPENPRYIYISNIDDQQKWKDFFTLYQDNFSTWIYTTKA